MLNELSPQQLLCYILDIFFCFVFVDFPVFFSKLKSVWEGVSRVACFRSVDHWFKSQLKNVGGLYEEHML